MEERPENGRRGAGRGGEGRREKEAKKTKKKKKAGVPKKPGKPKGTTQASARRESAGRYANLQCARQRLALLGCNAEDEPM